MQKTPMHRCLACRAAMGMGVQDASRALLGIAGLASVDQVVLISNMPGVLKAVMSSRRSFSCSRTSLSLRSSRDSTAMLLNRFMVCSIVSSRPGPRPPGPNGPGPDPDLLLLLPPLNGILLLSLT